MEPRPELSAAIAAARAVRPTFQEDPDAVVLSDLGAIEELGRIVDGLRIAAAAAAERKSHPSPEGGGRRS